ncbi:phosphoinositide 3-kinase adapter protein 1 [Anastrepha obliqua]|uniref:phosphoinositide 3-kinase adapter protein 1 n=1 Tax=Anastrepha obliqua TaxID=95512 RepID=UPI002409E123|nr:phosphoinositide 3-kinase adapter protein 1 [Anastrepha obliqua]
MSVDNPYYFYNDNKSPRTPDSQSSSKAFSIFKRRNSKGSSPRVIIPEQTRLITSANLDSAATMALGSPRGSFGSLGGFSQQSFELQPLMYRQRSSNSHSETFRERLGSYNESNSSSVGGGGGGGADFDDVFCMSPSSKHHHTLPNSNTRRHSFGNWRQANERHHHKNTALSTPDEVPNMMAPRPPVLSPNKYRGLHRRRDNCGTVSNSSSNGSGPYNMDDILIITAKHSERAILRANFLKNHFDKITKQRGRKPFNFLHIKIEDGPFSEEIAHKYQNTALQIVILCPALLALSHSFLLSQLTAIIRVEKVLGILLDITEEKVKEIQKTALPSYYKWRRCTIRDNDQAQISNILGIATDILGRALCQRPPCHDHSSISRSFSSCSEGFTILPKKVKIGQNKVVAMLAEPLEKDDTIKIMVEKSGELIEIRNFKCRNPFTVQFSIPESCMEISTMVEIRIEKNEKSLGARPIKCESRMRELEQLLRTEDSPIEFMCHSLGIGPAERDALDLHLLQCFQKNMPPNFHLLNGPYEKQHHFLTIRESSPEEYPTLLHFAARWGLNRLCIQLMECPGGDTACGIRNCTGKTPAELAEQEGHHKLATNIVSFSEFHELTTMYHYFKGISGTGTQNNNNQPMVNGKIDNNNQNLNHPSSNKVVIEMVKSTPASPKVKQPKPQKPMPQEPQETLSAEYMEMSSGSERENTPDAKPKVETLAVSNLNYISVEAEDENLQGSSADVCKNFEKVLTTPEITTNELRISEPPYYQSKEQNKSVDVTDSPYQTDKFSHECSQLLENCSGTTAGNDYVLQPANIPIPPKLVATQTPADIASANSDDGNYLFQPSNRPVEDELLPQNRLSLTRSLSSSSRPGQNPTYGTLKRTASDASSATTRSNADDELAEIMHDFKNNVLSIRDVEVLVEKWKHRNDVQQSFREKQEQIDQMRKEYERIQDNLRSQLKRETPFEKIKKLFSRHKSTTPLSDKTVGTDSALDETKSSITTSSSFKSSQRPISSLSLQSVSSSSSSGRLSTGSNCSGTSLGDSGTHSDHEERRFGCRLGSPGTLMDNYLVPPPPRPVLTPNSTPGEERHQLVFPSPKSSHQRLNMPTSPTGSEHYQMFPSNIPVYTSQNLSTSQPNNYLNTIMEAKEHDGGGGGVATGTTTNSSNSHQYQNGVTLQPIKINERSNIIYGKLMKASPTCSSFKPKQVAVPQVGSIEVQAEVYQNIGSNLEHIKEGEMAKDLVKEGTAGETATEAPNYMNC